ncbi:preprotein translocase subunit SecA [Candidatus Phytoplasma phoenicium]|uniref:preprotein translocase subunit SecA n=1 Tax=Candidatus Phytoplasma phoenicium TaxID=198422 RepID=UPI00067E45E7|nr:preprotein translocase subunit SecA [Candidatus Phytoplasma phoenicium]
MFNFWKNFFNSSNKYLKKIKPKALQIEKLNDFYSKFKNEQFIAETEKFKQMYRNGTSLDELLVPAFALVCEACKRITGLTPYHVQILGAIVLHQGQIIEMKTGEGKTLTSVLPAYLNALSEKSVHIVTVNEYLAQREAQGQIGDIFRFLGISVGLNTKDKNFQEKKQAYSCDILYSTNSELGFDYLRDNMATDINEVLMQKEYKYAIIDEVDSILIDESRTPLIISSRAQKGKKFYHDANRFAKILKENNYIIDLESKTIELTEEGIKKGEKFFQIKNLYSNHNRHLLHFIKNALKACFLMEKNKDYLVDKNQILIIDKFTGRILQGRQFSDGLQQALEAKEGCSIKEETEISATITYQNFFRIYEKLSGMTGTAKTEEKEFISIYNTKVIEIPTHKLMIREDAPDFVFTTMQAKWEALLKEVEYRYQKQQPVLIGTVTVETSEHISQKLKKQKIPHFVLNAKNHFKESEIIAKAGHKGSITIATNMAGRGTDIRLGEGVVELGGLVVLGTERHESRRIDNQLRGRAGRQGDPGFSRFFVSGEDDLVKRFGGNQIQRLIMLLQKTQINNNNPTSSRIFTKFITNLQKKIESLNFSYRKFILQFDSVLGFQRNIIYQQRKDILTSDKIEDIVFPLVIKTLRAKIITFMKHQNHLKEEKDFNDLIYYLENLFFPPKTFVIKEFKNINNNIMNRQEILQLIEKKVEHLKEEQKQKFNKNQKNHYSIILKLIMLRNIDTNFKRHIVDMHVLTKSINFVSYGQKDTLITYQQEGQKFFNQMIDNISFDITRLVLKLSLLEEEFTKILN